MKKFFYFYVEILMRPVIMEAEKRKKEMATFTKKQFKKRIEELKEKLQDLRLEFEDLQSDLETESGDIEPYEGRNDLTSLQMERQEWLDNTASTIEETVSRLQDGEDNLDYIEE